MKKQEKDWLRLRPYTHFTPKLEYQDISWIRAYVKDKVSTHKFYPFIHYSKVLNQYKRKYDETLKRRKNNRESKCKKREIFFANHLDTQVYAYYAYQLKNLLEEKVFQKDELLNQSVIGYRSVEIKGKKRNKSNIDFANDAFEFIRREVEKDGHRIAICLDISDFFPSLNHGFLKKQWKELLGENIKALPDDHYNIFKSITKYSYVEISDLINEFTELKIKNFSRLRLKEIDSFCKNASEFRSRVVAKGHVRKHNGNGIAQGTPISAVLSNIYMLPFDRHFSQLLDSLGGNYWRYSDDILIVCKPEHAEEVTQACMTFIREELKLVIKEEKNQTVSFKVNEHGKITTLFTSNNVKSYGKPLQYLGFTFDGRTKRIRNKSVSAFYRKLKRQIRRGAHFANLAKQRNEQANYGKQTDPWIYRSSIYKSKSHLGIKKKKLNGKIYWGNFISYAYNAAKQMNSPEIKRQVRNHWKVIESEIAEWEKTHNLEKTPSKRNKNAHHKI